jgi:hypothetical protein
MTRNDLICDPDTLSRQLRQKAYNRDGLPEMAVGVSFLLIAALMGIQTQLQHGSLAARAASTALTFSILATAFASSRLIAWLRARFLVERVGYVKAKQRKDLRFWTLRIAAGLVSCAVVLVMVRFHRSIQDWWAVLGTGLLLGVGTAWLGRMRRFVLNGSLIVLAAVVIALQGLSQDAGFAWIYGVTGALYALSGGIVLGNLLRQPLESGD